MRARDDVDESRDTGYADALEADGVLTTRRATKAHRGMISI